MTTLVKHEAVPYAGRASFAPTCASAVRAGLAADQQLLVLADAGKIEDVRDELGRDVDDVTFVATDEHGRNPSRITALLYSFQAGAGGRQCLGVSEVIVHGRSPAALLEARLSDQLLSHPALRDWPLSVLCLGDTDAMDDDALLALRRSHAVVQGESGNPEFRADLAGSVYSAGLPAPPDYAARLHVQGPGLREMRTFVGGTADAVGVTPDRVEDLVLAANEVVTNSVRYGGGDAHVAMWFDGDSVVCDVRDHGHIDDVLAGRCAPPPSANSGRGLWLVNHLCDLVQLRSSAAGSIVRMFVDR